MAPLKKSISGIRGVFGNDLTLKETIEFCRNFSSFIKSSRCVIGKDTRPSSNIMSQVAIATLLSYGIDVYDLGISPTPVVFREARKYGSGIVITSSHNPLEWNGIKFIVDGRGPNQKEFEKILSQKPQITKKIGTLKNTTSDYVAQAAKLVGRAPHQPKVVVDVGGGAAYHVAPQLLKRIGCQVKVINEKSKKRGPDPTTDKLGQLISQSKHADIGFAFDLDGDRLVVVKNGKKQSADVTLALGVSRALFLGYKKFCLSVDSSISIEKYIENHGGQVVYSKVGEANVVDTIIKKRCNAGGEGSSGGFILPQFNMCRDGILTAGLIASMSNTQIDDVINFVSRYTQLRSKLQISSKTHDKILKTLAKKLGNIFDQIITLDGLKVVVDSDTWGLIRKSNTEDTIRISTESTSLNKAKQLQNKLISMLRQSYDQTK